MTVMVDGGVGLISEEVEMSDDTLPNKPFDPVLLSAIVKTRSERFREIRRSTHLHGFTGPFIDTTVKLCPQTMVAKAESHGRCQRSFSSRRS